jgi:hypothetical protein
MEELSQIISDLSDLNALTRTDQRTAEILKAQTEYDDKVITRAQGAAKLAILQSARVAAEYEFSTSAYNDALKAYNDALKAQEDLIKTIESLTQTLANELESFESANDFDKQTIGNSMTETRETLRAKHIAKTAGVANLKRLQSALVAARDAYLKSTQP